MQRQIKIKAFCIASGICGSLHIFFKQLHFGFNFKVTQQSCVLKFSPLTANPTKWSNTLKQFVGNLPTNFLSEFDGFVKWRNFPTLIGLA